MRVIRYGKQSREVSASNEARLDVVSSDKNSYGARARLDITGFAGIERGSMLAVELEEAELRRTLAAIDAARVRKEARARKAIDERCAKQEGRLDLIYELMNSQLSLDFEWRTGPMRARDRRVLKVVKSLALGSSQVAAARRMLKKVKR